MLVKVKRWAQITLPAEVRRSLGIDEGDYLEAEVVGGGVLLRPVTVSPREVAWDEVAAIVRRPKQRGGKPEPSDDALMREVIGEIKAVRRGHAKRRPR